MNFLLILNVTLTVICFVHVSIVLYQQLYPEEPSIKYYEKKLEQIEFPVNLKYCLTLPDEREFWKKFGYKLVWEFYYGQSVYNDSIYGWKGHLENGSDLFNSSKGNCHSHINKVSQ